MNNEDFRKLVQSKIPDTNSKDIAREAVENDHRKRNKRRPPHHAARNRPAKSARSNEASDDNDKFVPSMQYRDRAKERREGILQHGQEGEEDLVAKPKLSVADAMFEAAVDAFETEKQLKSDENDLESLSSNDKERPFRPFETRQQALHWLQSDHQPATEMGRDVRHCLQELYLKSLQTKMLPHQQILLSLSRIVAPPKVHVYAATDPVPKASSLGHELIDHVALSLERAKTRATRKREALKKPLPANQAVSSDEDDIFDTAGEYNAQDRTDDEQHDAAFNKPVDHLFDRSQEEQNLYHEVAPNIVVKDTETADDGIDMDYGARDYDEDPPDDAKKKKKKRKKANTDSP